MIVPIFRTEEDRAAVAGAIERLERSLADVQTASGPLRFKVDWREESPGFKYNHWELRGVPFRLEIGPRDVAAGQGVLVRRIDRDKETRAARRARRPSCPAAWPTTRRQLFQRALDFRAANTHDGRHYDEFKAGRSKGRAAS